jgi:hypothetical protein
MCSKKINVTTKKAWEISFNATYRNVNDSLMNAICRKRTPVIFTAVFTDTSLVLTNIISNATRDISYHATWNTCYDVIQDSTTREPKFAAW